MALRPLVFIVGLAVCAASASAQLITIRTVPISVDDQFQIFPSQRAGMGNVSLALTDSLLDPFGNPATAARVRRAQFFGSPSFYTVTSKAGAGRTLPLGMLIRGDMWFGGVWGAVQQVDAWGADPREPIRPVSLQQSITDAEGLLTDIYAPSHRNQFLFAQVGRVVSSGLSIGGSASWAGLTAIDGVDMLYANSLGVRQYGHSLDLRVGALKEWDGQSLEAVAVHNRFRMTHDVAQLESFWDPAAAQNRQRTRLERNLDHTDTWGAHVQYERPLAFAASGWRMGWVATANHKTHPKIPNYEIMSIPRDPGGSNALNLGVGISHSRTGLTFGADFIYEPIWSHTWADAAAPVLTVAGTTIPAGGMTIENHFRFSNALIRIGLNSDFGVPVGNENSVQIGLVLRAISYDLEQRDHVRFTFRRQHESWIEWTPTWGLRVGFSALQLRYQGRLTNGTGRPSVNGGGGCVCDFFRPDFLPAAGGALSVDKIRILSHQFSISLPLR